MASTPVLRKMLAAVEKNGGWEEIVHRVAAGETIAKIAKSFNVSRSFFNWQMYKQAPEGFREAIAEARKLAAEAYVEDAKDISDDADTSTREALAKDKLRVETRLMIAAKFNPERFGTKQGDINVNVLSIGDQHLNALRARVVDPVLQQQPPAPELLPAEIVPADEEK